jgi:BirA family biotin operon repressor/biotin-[acetyl-CoA-carboxylase] ligase
VAIQFDVRRHATVTSTMDVAGELVRDGAPEGVVVVAERQTSGRGRRGRSWASPPSGGLYVSVVLRMPQEAEPRRLPLTTLAAGVAVHDAIRCVTPLAVELKWPNDVMCRGRKLAGILAEASSSGPHDQAIIVGIGINVSPAALPPDVAERATSLEGESGQRVDREALLDAVLAAVAARHEQLREGDRDGILRAWRAAAPAARGARVAWNDGSKQGVTAGIDEAGALLIDTGHAIERVIAGELIWL